MEREMLVAIMAAISVARLVAVTVGPDWCVSYPEAGSPDVNYALRIAAEEVRDDINKATGLNLKAVPASKAKSPAIYIGAEFAEKAGFDLSGMKWWANAIAEKGGNIYLFGNDRPGRDREKFGRGLDWFRCVLPSVRASTRFLEASAGVRFLMPGEVGKEVPQRKTVSVADGFLDTEMPRIIYGNGRSGNNRSLVFLVANGIWGMGAYHTYGGHTHPNACPSDRYFKTHPEYFAMKNGKRVLGQTPQQTALCISNPDVEELIVEELKRQFDMGADICQLSQHDGGMVCECDRCRAMYGTGDDWGEKFWIFHRHIAERIQKECPGKVVNILSYTATENPPKTFKVFPSNVMIEMTVQRDELFEKWKGYAIPHGLSVYTTLGGTFVPLGFVARQSFAYLAVLAKRFRDSNVCGVYRCETWGDLYGTEGPGYYVFNKLLHNGSLNLNELLTDYCNVAFGPAAAYMRQFYDVQDSRLRLCDRISDREYYPEAAAGMSEYCKTRLKNPLDIHGFVFSPETVAQMEESLSRAEKTADLSGKQKKRLELVRLEFDYAKNLGAISTLYSAYKLRPTKEMLAPLAKELEKRNVMLDRIFGGNDRPMKLEGWPELVPFGWACTRNLMKTNGRLMGKIGAPLTWPPKMLKDALPGVNMKRTEAVRTGAVPTFLDFEVGTGWNDLGGLSMEEIPFKARFKAMYDDLALYVLVEGDLADNAAVKTFPRDGRVWNDECVDMSIAPGNTKDIWYHFIYGTDASSRYDDATGLIKDPLDPSYGKADALWNGKGWRTVNSRKGGKWRSIAMFPYSDFGVAAPKPGDSWFLNIGRVFKTGTDRKAEVLALWSPNMESRSMSAPSAMGKLIFR